MKSKVEKGYTHAASVMSLLSKMMKKRQWADIPQKTKDALQVRELLRTTDQALGAMLDLEVEESPMPENL